MIKNIEIIMDEVLKCPYFKQINLSKTHTYKFAGQKLNYLSGGVH